MDQLERGITEEDGVEGDGTGVIVLGTKVVRIDKAEAPDTGFIVQMVTKGGDRTAVLASVVINSAGLRWALFVGSTLCTYELTS